MTDEAGSSPGDTGGGDGTGGTTEVRSGEGSDPDRPAPEREVESVPEMYRAWDGPDRRPSGGREWLRWFRTVESGPVMLAREVLSSVGFVVGVGLLLFAVSGVWPPMVAVQSGSMEPHMHRGDLVFIVAEGRYAGDAAVQGTGVVTARSAESYRKFGQQGDVIVYRPDGSDRRDPIIHRARFWVEDGENWYRRANEDHIDARNCEQLANCPAPNSGFITKGDANDNYDQAEGMSRPVKPSWVKGKAMIRVPWLGLIRLEFADAAALAGLGRGIAAAFGAAAVSTRLVGR